MDRHHVLAESFEAHRGRLRAVAYRMLGSLSEADDAVQETWLRLSRSDAEAVRNMGGWLTTVVGRVCPDLLRSRHQRREEPLEVRVPDPEDQALIADSVGLALLVVLETLARAERLAFVLHDLFGVPFDEIAPLVDRSPAAAGQLASRARRRVRGAAPAPDPDLARVRRQRGRPAASGVWCRGHLPAVAGGRSQGGGSPSYRAYSGDSDNAAGGTSQR
ncbi:sigma-70 family RNA polymerase sigma factor [Streptomyces sp. 205]|uniref:Sigma-70 family RNA polymerase sigma factor n=1 Tax=Streptomyces coffeae TaxID=621382 RepID=A0ABS1NFT3_9ACTN|nr:sigma-70 family RNA polymerase sigma factor [Streptomyces coffeae]